MISAAALSATTSSGYSLAQSARFTGGPVSVTVTSTSPEPVTWKPWRRPASGTSATYRPRTSRPVHSGPARSWLTAATCGRPVHRCRRWPAVAPGIRRRTG